MSPASKSSDLPGAIAAFSLEKFATSLRADFRFAPLNVLILVVIIFLLTRVFPSDPARQLAGPFAPQERVDQITEENGFDDPLLTQLGDLLRSVVTFDYGETVDVKPAASGPDTETAVQSPVKNQSSITVE